jgi:hypothetical protein
MKKQTIMLLAAVGVALYVMNRGEDWKTTNANFCHDKANHGKPVPNMPGFVCGKNQTAIAKVNKGKTGG